MSLRGYFNWNEKPPELKHIMESIVNYDSDTIHGLSELAKLGRSKIFSFDYDLDESLFTKEEFECAIINNFIDRRIGYETVGAFKLKLEIKIKEIIPTINLMVATFNELKTNGLIDKEIRNKTENNNYLKEEKGSIGSTITSDNRYSNTPQNKINDVKSGDYLTDYTYNTNTNNTNNNINTSDNDNLDLHEEKIKINSKDTIDNLEIVKKINNIYSYTFKKLECLFYNLI